MLKGIRGAIDVEENKAEEIYIKTKELLNTINDLNQLKKENIVAVIFSATPDLTAAYPAKAARDLGWTNVPMMCLQEMAVEGSLERCLRVLILINNFNENEVKHVYLGKAKKLRPDLI